MGYQSVPAAPTPSEWRELASDLAPVRRERELAMSVTRPERGARRRPRCLRTAGWLWSLTIVLLVSATTPAPEAVAQDRVAGADSFVQTWEVLDRPVALERVSRSWFWGPAPFTPALYEWYRESPGNARLVQYFDKGRMEITDPASDPNDHWYVTGGLLTRELVSGRIQLGDSEFLDAGGGAPIPIAGDLDNPFPTYADLTQLIDRPQPERTGEFATAVLTPDGLDIRPEASQDSEAQFVQHVQYVGPFGQAVGYNLPRAFWDFMTQRGLAWHDGQLEPIDPLFDWLTVLGYPIADPFWAHVRLNGSPTWVLIQPFERRLLTYTPSNPPGWKVEMSNTGLHYYRWRYQFTPPRGLGSGASYYGLMPGSRWVYGTSLGVQETWEIGQPTDHFVAGSTLIPRAERGPRGARVTYWGITDDGILLYGSETLRRDGTVGEVVLYWPPIRLLAAADLQEGARWSTETLVLSTRSSPQPLTVAVRVQEAQLVSTTYGIVPAWQLLVTETRAGGSVNTHVSWFSPSLGIVQWTGHGYAAQLRSATIPQ